MLRLAAIAMAFALLMCAGCSSTNLNGFNIRMSGIWTKASPLDAQTPGKVEVGAGTASLTIIPMARGQGAEFRAVTFELISGRPLFYEEIIIYPVGQDGVLKLSKEPASVLKIPFILDLKAGEPVNTIEFVPDKK